MCSEQSRIEDLIIESVFNSLDHKDYQILNNHLKHCSSCRRLSRKYSAIFYASGLLKKNHPEVDWTRFTSDLMQKIDNENSLKQPRLSLALPLSLGFAVLILLFFTAGIIKLYTPQKRLLEPPVPVRIATSVSTKPFPIHHNTYRKKSFASERLPATHVRSIPDHPIYIVPLNPAEKASIIVDVPDKRSWH